MVVGNPSKIIKQVSDEMLAWKTSGTQLYQQLPQQLFDTWKECEPLRVVEDDRINQDKVYKPWTATKTAPAQSDNNGR